MKRIFHYPIHTVLPLVLLILATRCWSVEYTNCEDISELTSTISPLPRGVVVTKDVAYGDSPYQSYDVYRPLLPATKANTRPIIVMVHGGLWGYGDKSAENVVANKVARWVPRGFVFVSINYRLTPEVRAVEQAEDVLDAIEDIRAHADLYQGDPDALILMGHSAGGHLALLASATQNAYWTSTGFRAIEPWLGTISIDTAAYHVPDRMNQLVDGSAIYEAYLDAFTRFATYQRRASPFHQLAPYGPPILAICSTVREDQPCIQAQEYVEEGAQQDREIVLLPCNAGHAALNILLGLENSYTRDVEAFMGALDPKVAKRLPLDKKGY